MTPDFALLGEFGGKSVADSSEGNGTPLDVVLSVLGRHQAEEDVGGCFKPDPRYHAKKEARKFGPFSIHTPN